MGKNIFFLCETFSEGARKLHESLYNSKIPVRTVVIEDDGYLPEGVESVLDYFLKKNKNNQDHKKDNSNKNDQDLKEDTNNKGSLGRPRFFNEIRIPDYWEISATNSNGAVHDKNKERARIYFAEPLNKRHVKIVDWVDETGIVRYSDHYNSVGALFARTIFNNKGEKVDRSFFDINGKEVIVENYVTRDILIEFDDKIHIFKSKTELVCFFLEKNGFEPEDMLVFNSLSTPFFVSQRMNQLYGISVVHADDGDNVTGDKDNSYGQNDILFWQEPTGDEIPGNMKIIYSGAKKKINEGKRIESDTRTGRIFVQNRESYNKLINLGGDPKITKQLGYVYSYTRSNQDRKEVLICTNSDHIESLEYLVEALPEVHFNIAALTEMSSKLMSMSSHHNVTLFPGIREKILDSLFEKCDFYMDINSGNEIVSAVKRAYYNNMLITGFEETVHNKEYIASKHIYGKAKKDELVGIISSAVTNNEFLNAELEIQRNYALECSPEMYRSVFNIKG